MIDTMKRWILQESFDPHISAPLEHGILMSPWREDEEGIGTIAKYSDRKDRCVSRATVDISRRTVYLSRLHDTSACSQWAHVHRIRPTSIILPMRTQSCCISYSATAAATHIAPKSKLDPAATRAGIQFGLSRIENALSRRDLSKD